MSSPGFPKRLLSLAALVVLCALLFSACKSSKKEPAAEAPAAEKPALGTVKSCEACHAAIVEEWRSSMHANSTQENDPLYALLYGKAVVKMGAAAEKACRKCHYPEATGAAEKPEVEGVSCTVCHQIEPNHPDPEPSARKIVFARGHEAHSGALGLCLSCHGELRGPDGEPVCTTGAEAEAARTEDCLDCHMKKVEGPALRPGSGQALLHGPADSQHRSHRFPGGHVKSQVAGAAELELAVNEGRIAATVSAGEIGHSLPTGNPMRHLVLAVEAFDAAGESLWRNVSGASPPLEARDAVFMRVYSSADGKSPVPPFMAAGPPDDNRLAPGEKRTLSYDLPSGSKRIDARLIYHLGPKKVLEAARVMIEPVVVAETSLEL